AAAVYTHDAFVPREMSLETAALLPKCEVWETDAYEHNGLAASDGEVLRRLNGLLEGMNAAG
ncbi:MAG TPA: prolyl aminopeptidase, partial [Brevibacterium ravenspurgense]|nr:prolyl aminopeptidase [Brevibacterium ravenspurgense]